MFFVYLVLFLTSAATSHSRTSSGFDFVTELQGYHKGDRSEGIQRFRNYLERFGYLNPSQTTQSADHFDDVLESAIKTYQQNFQIPPSGKLDSATVSKLTAPRCGVADIINGVNYMQRNRSETRGSGSTGLRIVPHYALLPGSPRWSTKELTYSFLSGFPRTAVSPVRRAFKKWTSATKYFSFSEVDQGQISDLTLGYYQGDHEDGAPFDGPGGVLAHAFGPTDGRLHLDADEEWSLGDPASTEIDLETVAVHEIGHLLGLAHTDDVEAIMYPSISPGRVKSIQSDDIQGIKDLYEL